MSESSAVWEFRIRTIEFTATLKNSVDLPQTRLIPTTELFSLPLIRKTMFDQMQECICREPGLVKAQGRACTNQLQNLISFEFSHAKLQLNFQTLTPNR